MGGRRGASRRCWGAGRAQGGRHGGAGGAGRAQGASWLRWGAATQGAPAKSTEGERWHGGKRQRGCGGGGAHQGRWRRRCDTSQIYL
jgi:hypothetical protein